MNEHILTRKQVVALTGMSATSLWRACRGGTFPHPRQISTARIGWLESEISEWIRSRPVVERRGVNNE